MPAFAERQDTWMVTLECQSGLSGPRFLHGGATEPHVTLATESDPPLNGTWWALIRVAPDVVKLRCMTPVQNARYLDGRPPQGKVGLRPMLASPPSGEWWRIAQHPDESVTFECLSKFQDSRHRFLDGRTLDNTVGLAPDTSPAGTHWHMKRHGRIVALWCEGVVPGTHNRFLDGVLRDDSVGLAPIAMGHFTGTWWLLHDTGNGFSLMCLGELDSDKRFLDGVLDPFPGRVRLANTTQPPFTGTHWEMAKPTHGNDHTDVEPGFFSTFKCLGAVPGAQNTFLDGALERQEIGLAPNQDGVFTGTRWRVLPAGPFFEPCPRFREEPDPDRTVDVVRTVRIGQLTGAPDPEGRPTLNGSTDNIGVPGIDLGANTEDEHGRLFVFFGDVVRGERNGGPEVDADAVGVITDLFVDERLEEFPEGGGGGVHLRFIVGGDGFFEPFSVAGPIGPTLTMEVPSGAFCHADRTFVFFHIWARPRNPAPDVGCYIASKEDPGLAGPYALECLFSPRRRNSDGKLGTDTFSGVAPVKVRKADHPWLPDDPEVNAEEGLVMFGLGTNPRLGYSAVHLAWMPLTDTTIDLSTVRYLAGDTSKFFWTPDAEQVLGLFGKTTNLQSICAAFLPGPKKWIVLYMSANGTDCPTGPIVARIGTPPFDWSEEFRLFDPCRERAYGRYMHWPGLGDVIAEHDPFRTKPVSDDDRHKLEAERKNKGPANAYGGFLLERYTSWDEETRTLDLYYLLSLWSPYQVQLMRTTLRLL